MTAGCLCATLYMRRSVMRKSHQHTMPYSATSGAAHTPARVLRLLVLTLIALLLVFVVLMPLTGHYEIGASVIGSILLIGFGAAQYAGK